MTDQHPMNPPTHMYDEWIDQAQALHPGESWGYISGEIARLAYQAGADQELEACCEVLGRELICDGKHVATDLRNVRRPKPPSLKQQALEALDRYTAEEWCEELTLDGDIIRRALEALPDE